MPPASGSSGGDYANGEPESHRDEDPERTLWMGDLSTDWTAEEIGEMFRKEYGDVSVYRPFDNRMQRLAPYAFVRFSDAESAHRAYDELAGADIPDYAGCRFRLNPRWRRNVPGNGKRRRSPSPPPHRSRRHRSEDDDRSVSSSSHRRNYNHRSGGGGRGSSADQQQPHHKGSPRGGRGGDYYRVTLWPGGRPGEVPPGTSIGKVLDEYLRRKFAGSHSASNDEDPEWRRVYDDARGEVVAAVVDGKLRARGDVVEESWRRVMPVLGTSFEGYDVLSRSLLFVAALAVSIELPGRRLNVLYNDNCATTLLDIVWKNVPSDEDAEGGDAHSVVVVDHARLETSMRQLIDLDVKLDAANVPIDSLEDQRHVAWTRNHSCLVTRSRVRVGDEVHVFVSPRPYPLVESTRALKRFDFGLEMFGKTLKLTTKARKPRPSTDCSVSVACAFSSSSSPPYDDAVAQSAAKIKRLFDGSSAVVNELMFVNPRRLAAADAALDIDVGQCADQLKGKTIVLVGPPGSAVALVASRLAAALEARGKLPSEIARLSGGQGASATRIRRQGLYYSGNPESFFSEELAANDVCVVRCEPFAQPNVDDLNCVSARDLKEIRCLVAADIELDAARLLDDLAEPSYYDGPQPIVVLNTSLPYELNALKPFVEPKLRDIKPTSPAYFRARQLLDTLAHFQAMLPHQLPHSSFLRVPLCDASRRHLLK